MKTYNDDTENQTLCIFDYATGAISGSNTLSDAEERDRIQEHARNRLEGFLNQNHMPRGN